MMFYRVESIVKRLDFLENKKNLSPITNIGRVATFIVKNTLFNVLKLF